MLTLGMVSACSTPAPKTAETSAAPEQGPPAREFYSKAFGFGITKPEGWYLIAESILKEDRNTIRLNDAELDRLARENPNFPLVVFTRYQEPFPTLNPSISVSVAFLPVEGVPPKDALTMSTEISRMAFPDLVVVDPVRDETVSGLQGAYTQVTYTAMFADGKKFPTRVRMLTVPRGKIMFVIGMTGPSDGPDVFQNIAADILNSIKIDPRP